MYRERKRYKPINDILRRILSTSSKISIIVIIFLVYSISLAPLMQKSLESKLLDFSNQTIAVSRGETLSPILMTDETSFSIDPSLYNLSLTEYSENEHFGESGLFVTTDPRVIALRQFLIDYNSPMYPYAEVFVKEADIYGLDWRLLVGISGVESAFGTLIPPNSHNGWGWKGDPTQAWSHFTSWTHAIQVITKGLALGYGTDLTPFQIEPTYCPPCGRTEGHPWANGVTRFMNEISYYLENL